MGVRFKGILPLVWIRGRLLNVSQGSSNFSSYLALSGPDVRVNFRLYQWKTQNLLWVHMNSCPQGAKIFCPRRAWSGRHGKRTAHPNYTLNVEKKISIGFPDTPVTVTASDDSWLGFERSTEKVAPVLRKKFISLPLTTRITQGSWKEITVLWGAGLGGPGAHQSCWPAGLLVLLPVISIPEGSLTSSGLLYR